MNKHFFERKIENFFPMPIIVIGIVMSLLGIYVTYRNPLIGVINIIFGLIFVFSKKGFQLDILEKKYKEYFGIWGIKRGSWKDLPDINLITITPSDTMYVNNAIAGGAQTISKSTLLKVNLKYHKADKIIASAGSKEKVFKDALLLSSLLKVDILDCSEAEQRKISYASLTQS